MFNPEIEFAKFWEAYEGRTLCESNSKKGPKSKAFSSYKKKVKDQLMADKVLFALIEQKKHHIELNRLDIWAPNFPQVTTWINQERWDTELDEIADLREDKNNQHLKEARQLDKCNIEGCNDDVHGPKFKQCGYHTTVTPRFKKKIVEDLKSKGIMKFKDESKQDWIVRLRTQAKKDIARMKDMVIR